MQFSVTAQRGLRGPVGARRPRPFASLSASGVVTRRTVLLTEIMDPASGEPVMALLNARPWMTDDLERPVVDTLEQWDIVNLTGDTHPIHLHLVQFQLRDRQAIHAARYLLDVFGADELDPSHIGAGTRPFPSADGYLAGPALGGDAWESGWKDTVQAHPGMVTRILVPFGPNAAPGVPFGTRVPAPFTGRYVWHCHILDHEDNEMMLPYEVVA
jgi:FtsP/CotA-like multicopper oxidase with cupredoxin domain